MVCKKTVNLTGAEQKVEFKGRHCDVRNDGAGVVYVSCTPGVEPDADGVLSIPPGQAVKYCGCRGVLYLLGEGKVLICGNDYSTQVFRGAATSSGEGGVTQSYVDMQDSDTLNKAKEYAEGLPVNPNLLDNPDFSINQRGFTEGVCGKKTYTVDRWYTVNAAAQVVTVDGDTVTVQRSGTTEIAAFGQPIEKLKAGTYTVAVDILRADASIGRIIGGVATESAAFASRVLVRPSNEFEVGRYSYTFDVPEDSENVMLYFFSTDFTEENATFVITKPKLELGPVATPFVLPNRALELVKCQRQYMPAPMESIPCLATTANSFYFLVPLPVTMRIKPSFTAETVLRLARCTGNITLAANLLNNSEYSVSTALFTNGLLVNVAKASHDISAGDVVLDISAGGLSAEL